MLGQQTDCYKKLAATLSQLTGTRDTALLTLKGIPTKLKVRILAMYLSSTTNWKSLLGRVYQLIISVLWGGSPHQE